MSLLQLPDRRDRYLLLKGCLSLLLGYAYAVAHVPRPTRNSLSTVTEHVPLEVFGWLWVAAGLYCIAAAFITRKMGGFAVAVVMPTLWGLAYLICWLHDDPGRGWVSAGIFWVIASATYHASGLIDPVALLRKAAGK